MFTAIKLFFGSGPGIIVAFVIAGLVAGAVTYHYAIVWGFESQVKTLKKEVTKLEGAVSDLKSRNASLEIENGNFKVSVEKQNSQIDTLNLAMAKNVKAAEVRAAQARKESLKWRGAYENVLNAPTKFPEKQAESLALRLDAYIDLRLKEATP